MEPIAVKKRTREDDPQLPASQEESTDIKLALLASLHPNIETETLLETLLVTNGSVEDASAVLSCSSHKPSSPARKKHITEKTLGYQSSLNNFRSNRDDGSPKKGATKKGRTLFLYSPEDIASFTPCSIIHNFLPADIANDLLQELVDDSPTYYSEEFQLFERTVKSPHTFCFYVDSDYDAERQKKDYVYNGESVKDVRCTLPHMKKVSGLVQKAVNNEIAKRIQSHYPGQVKLKYQSPDEWFPNASFVNCYDGPKENVGYHSDELTYLGPRAVIGSLSLGVAREFRVRKVVPRYRDFDLKDTAAKKADEMRADTEGQISIHLPHNSLLVMHAEMQEEWKHSIAPAQSIDPHPIAGNKRLNVTYRCYKDSFDPKYTPRCRCGIACTLKCVQKQADNRGKYMWMCHTGYIPGGKGCQFFEWATFDEDGEPPWSKRYKANSGNTKV